MSVANFSDKWKAFTGRVSLFPTPAPAFTWPSAFDFYRQVWKADPENFQSPSNAMQPSVAIGRHGGLAASCSAHPSRIDFGLLPLPPSTLPSGAALGLIEDAATLDSELHFVCAGLQSLDVMGPVNRVAIYVQLLAMNSGHAAANATLLAVLPDKYKLDLDAEEDVIVQINEPRGSSGAGGMRINYLTKWSVERLQVTMAMNVPGIPGQIPTQVLVAPKIETKEYIAASVSYDNNNAPAATPLSRAHQSALLTEMLSGPSAVLRGIGKHSRES